MNVMKSKLFLFIVIVVGLGLYLLVQPDMEVQQDLEAHPEMVAQANLEIEDTESELSEEGGLAMLMDGRCEQLIEHMAYTVSYNNDWKLPNWVAYELTKEETLGEVERCDGFSPDPKVKGEAVVHGDYTRNPGKYDRGHMAPAADMKWSESAMQESFYTTNICPQNANLNRGDWNDIEELVRDYAQRYGSVYIVCGPIVGDAPEYMGNYQKIAIPDAFYKAILRKKGDSWTTIGFVCKNEAGSKPILSYIRTIDEIEALAGVDLFYGLPDDIETKIEGEDNIADWAL
jgi:endonuclease G